MKIKSLLIGVLVGIVAFPTLAMGGSFVASLIEGKSVDEAVQILATQLDNLIGRVEIVETKQSGLQSQLGKAEACREADNLLIEIKETCGSQPFPGIDECITKRIRMADEYKNNPGSLEFSLGIANRLEELKPLYLSAKAQCEQ